MDGGSGYGTGDGMKSIWILAAAINLVGLWLGVSQADTFKSMISALGFAGSVVALLSD